MPQSTLSQANPSAAAEQVEYGVTRLGLATKWWVLVAIGVGTVMSALDGSVVNTVLPVSRAGMARLRQTFRLQAGRVSPNRDRIAPTGPYHAPVVTLSPRP